MAKGKSRKQELKDAFMRRYLYRETEEIKVQEICDDIHMSRTSFYHYYDYIDQIVDEEVETIIRRLQEYNRDFYKWNLRDFPSDMFERVHPTLEYMQENSLTFRALLKHRETNGFYEKWNAIIKKDFYKKYLAEGKSGPGMDIVLELIAAAIIGLYEYWLYHLEEIKEEDVIWGIYEILCGSFR